MVIDFKNKVFKGSNGRDTLLDCQIPVSAKAVVIFVHGFKGYKDWGAWELMQKKFVDAGFGFVKFNMSHNGGSINEPIDFPDLEAFGKNRYSYELNDLNIVIDETDRLIRQELALDLPIYIIGHSRGGGVSLLVSNQNEKVKKIVSLAGISDIGTRFPVGDELEDWKVDGVMYVENGRTKQSMPHFYSFYEDYLKNKDILNIQKAAEELKTPFLVVHGDMDLAVSISEGQQLLMWNRGNDLSERIAVVKGAGHTFGAVHPWESEKLPEDLERACNFIISFFDK